MPKQKLTQFIRSIEDPISSFLYCANYNCQAFRRQNEGKGEEKDYEDMTFFCSSVQNVLCSSKAMLLLEDAEIIVVYQEPDHSGTDLYFVLVTFPEERFPETKKKLQELLD